jgi:hypothetical protein
VTFTVDSINPVVNISAPVNGSSQTSTSTSAVFTVTDATTTTTTCKLDAAAAAACTSPQAYSGLSVGSHTITVVATDQAANTGSASTTFDVTPPASAPDTTITAAPGPATASTTPSFSFTATPPAGATFSCQLDAAAATACTSPFTAPALSDQTIHKFTVTASNAGGPDPTPAVTYFEVDTRPYGVSATVTKLANTLTTAANVSNPAAPECEGHEGCGPDPPARSKRFAGLDPEAEPLLSGSGIGGHLPGERQDRPGHGSDRHDRQPDRSHGYR